MTINFIEHHKIIDAFRGQVLKSNFDAAFIEATKHIPKTERFLLKMELKRLAGPCTRLIDLRGLVNGECKTFEDDKKIHFLDDVAIKVYKENIAQYGQYTFGVYEAVNNTKNNFRVMYKKDKAAIQSPSKVAEESNLDKTEYPAKLFQFSGHIDRCEERMNYSLAIEITLANKNIVESTCSDISVHGCKFKLSPVENFEIGDFLQIRFIGLEEEFNFGKENQFSYIIRNIQRTDEYLQLGVAWVVEQKSQVFQKFLQDFIQGNKRRYKINLDNTIKALESRGFEQYVMPKISELPVYLEFKHRVILPRYALTSSNNQHIIQYWQDENHHSTLHFLLTQLRVQKLKELAKVGKSLLVYSFIHKNKDKSYFYTADENQLREDSEFMKHFLGFAADKDSFAISDLSLLDVKEEYAHSPLTLSGTLLQKDQYLNEGPSQEVFSALKDFPYLVSITDVTDQKLVNDYQRLSFDNISTTKLKQLGHKRLNQQIIVDQVGINYKNQRKEARFQFKTPTLIETQGVQWPGVTCDFSTSGIKVELEKSTVLTKGDVVFLSFPKLQKITSSFDLKELPYEVMRINKAKTEIHLRVYVEKHQHIGRKFFKLLIDKNRDKLKSDEYITFNPGLANAFRNIYSQSLPSTFMMIQASGRRYKIEALASGKENGKLLSYMRELSEETDSYNLYPLLNNSQMTNLMSVALKKMHSSDKPISDLLYIAIDPKNDVLEKSVITKMESELPTLKLKALFINNALKNGLFFCLQIKLSRSEEPDMDHLNPELSYVSSYAIHRGKQIEQDIWSVVGMIQLFDITHEALIRFKTAL